MNKNYDDLLAIETDNKGMLTNESTTYNPYEATPYSILYALFQKYQLKRTDVFVDFGSGKGRLLFYVHNRFKASVTGIEMNEQLHHKTLKNKRKYLQKTKSNKNCITIKNCLAEDYQVTEKDNKFYFFNPFSVQVFSKVIGNIIDSVKKKPRTVDVILYYPTTEYVQYLEEYTPFDCIQEVRVPGLYNINNNERFLLFRLDNE